MKPRQGARLWRGTFSPVRPSISAGGMDMMKRFIPREKLGKKARALLDREKRASWGLSPVTRRVESRKRYSRKGRLPEEY